MNSEGEVIDSSEGMSELFNDAFGKVFTTVGDVPEVEWEYGDQQSTGISDIIMDEEPVMQRLDKLRDDKAAGADELIPRFLNKIKEELEMWANAQRDGRPAEYRWRPLLNAAVWLTPTTRVPCSNAAKTRNLLKLPGVPQTNETISASSRPKFAILYRDM